MIIAFEILSAKRCARIFWGLETMTGPFLEEHHDLFVFRTLVATKVVHLPYQLSSTIMALMGKRSRDRFHRRGEIKENT